MSGWVEYFLLLAARLRFSQDPSSRLINRKFMLRPYFIHLKKSNSPDAREHLSSRLTRKTRLKSHFRGWKNATVRTSTSTSVAHPLPQQRPELYGPHCGMWT
jgi:hypothetical protein